MKACVDEAVHLVDHRVAMKCTAQSIVKGGSHAVLMLLRVGDPAGLQAGGREVVVDLFSGAGFFSLAVAANAAEVYGFELSAGAVADAEV